jgi:molybdopterin-binding protein
LQKGEEFMRSKFNAQVCKVLLGFMLVGIVLSYGSVSFADPSAPPSKNKYFSVTTETVQDGRDVDKIIINSPPIPPPGFELQRQAVSLPVPDSSAGIKTLSVPAFNWVFGCSAVSGAMIAGYYDRTGYPNMYTGPTNGGLTPLDNSSWPTWSDGYATYPNCPLIASKNGVDGSTIKGSIDDYWVRYDSTASDPYITGAWTQHVWGTAIGDYMKTSQSAYGNTDGSTSFYNYTESALPLTCADMVTYGIADVDGTYGRKLFYEARGYTVTDCYSQKTDNIIPGGFSFNQFKAEIDADRPVMLNLAGHTVVGVGYDDTLNTVYIHDTWDYNNHTMTWGGSYSGMQLLSVSIVNFESEQNAAVTIVSPNGGETLTRGTVVPITWSYTGDPGENVKIELYNGSTLSSTITSSTSLSAGSYNWAIPSTQAFGSNYTIKVTSTTNSAISDTSDGPFTITETSITVTSPNGGETLVRGAVVPITWSYSGNPGASVKIQLYNGTTLSSTITSSTSLSAGSYNWTIPSTQAFGSNYTIKVTSTTNSAISDTSNGPFTITGPSITVTSPNGGETLVRGSVATLTWSYTGNPGASVKIQLYNGTTLSRTITSSTPLSAGTYKWAISSLQSLGSNYKIKITSTTNSTISDTSNGTFTIAKPSITVISPNGGESFSRGSVIPIRWSSVGSPGANVKILLYKGFYVSRTITTSTPMSAGTYNWTIPLTQTVGSTYKIKIVSTTNSSVGDASNASFTIK